jgi:thiamine phosphate synthase YjbQ (UPF0047 family)
MWISRATWPRASPLSSGLQQFSYRLRVDTNGKGLYEITRPLAHWLSECAIGTGLLTVFLQHTSASLTIQENADPDVQHDLNAFFNRLVAETLTQLSIPVEGGRLALGTWQGVYVFEHRAAAHRRSVVLHLLGT